MRAYNVAFVRPLLLLENTCVTEVGGVRHSRVAEYLHASGAILLAAPAAPVFCSFVQSWTGDRMYCCKLRLPSGDRSNVAQQRSVGT